MPAVDIICLANSKKLGGRCIAGLRLDGQGWIRPVGPSETGELYPEHYILDDGTAPQLLDILTIYVSHPDPKPYQPENWLISKGKWKLKIRPSDSEEAMQVLLPLLEKLSEEGPDLFGNYSDRARSDFLLKNPPESSLILVAPERPRWRVELGSGRPRMRAMFELGDVAYDLAITDLIWIGRLSKLEEGVYSSNEVGLKKSEKIFLTISLGEPFHGSCYKLVSAVIVMKATENSTRTKTNKRK